MGKSAFSTIVVALAWMLIASAPSASAQQESVPQGMRAAHRDARLAPDVPRSHNFGGHAYRGQLAWRNGRWHHATRKGRFGWWWDVGGVWYFYPEPFEGAPGFVSDIEADDEPATAPAPQLPKEPAHAFYYRPGDFSGVRYETLKECGQARQEAGNVGVCVVK